MKIRNFSLCITFFALMIAIWCVTPPETNLIIKSVCTILIISAYLVNLFDKRFRLANFMLYHLRRLCYLCVSVLCYLGHASFKGISRLAYLIALPFKLLRSIRRFLSSDLVYRLLQTCGNKFYQLDNLLERCCLKLASQSFQTDLALLRERRHNIIEKLGYDRQPHHPLYRTKFWCNVTNLFCCLAMLTASLALFGHLFSQVILYLFNIILLYYIATITSLSTTFEEYDPPTTEPTDPNTGIGCIIMQFGLPIVFFIFSLLAAITSSENATKISIFDSFCFTIQLSTISFHLTIPQAIITVSTLLALLGYGNLCVAAHDIAYPPGHQSES